MELSISRHNDDCEDIILSVITIIEFECDFTDHDKIPFSLTVEVQDDLEFPFACSALIPGPF